MNNNPIRRDILKLLYASFKDGKPYTEGMDIINSLEFDKKDINANLHYLEDKQLINIIWRTGGFPVAKINASGIDLLEDESEFNKRFPVSITYDSSIKINNVTGNLTGIGVSGDKNKISSSATISDSFNINKNLLSEIPKEYATALEDFTKNIERQIKKYDLEEENINKIQDSITDLIRETKGIKKDKEIGVLKQQEWKDKFFKVLKNVLPVLPKTAETIIAFSPLSPFSKIIGDAVEKVVEKVQTEL